MGGPPCLEAAHPPDCGWRILAVGGSARADLLPAQACERVWSLCFFFSVCSRQRGFSAFSPPAGLTGGHLS